MTKPLRRISGGIAAVLFLGLISRAWAQSGQYPNDTLFPKQWALNNTGQTHGKPGADIHALDAWKLTRCSADITIAMLDTGVDPQHPDLASKLVPGASFVAGVTSTQDDNGHGTGTAGVVAAATDNSLGIAGICPLGKIMPVKVANAGGHTDDVMVAAGVHWAVDHGARVINMSLGTEDIPQMKSAVAYAYAHGVVVVAATPGGDTYPADYAHVIAVAGSDAQDRPIDAVIHATHDLVLAPADNVVTTAAGGGYQVFCTCVSIAAPQVTGVVALVLSMRPTLTVDQVVSAIEQGADPVAGQAGFNSIDGFGRVNAFHSLQIAQNFPVAAPVPTAAPARKFLTVSVGATSVRVSHKETITVQTVPGAHVVLRIQYAGARYIYHRGVSGSTGNLRYGWHVPHRPGPVDVKVTVTVGGETHSKTVHFTIR